MPDPAALPEELVDGIPDPAALLDDRGQISVANGALASLFAREQCQGRTLLELSPSGGKRPRGRCTAPACARSFACPRRTWWCRRRLRRSPAVACCWSCAT